MSRESPPFLTVSLPLLLVLTMVAGAIGVAPCQQASSMDTEQGCLGRKSGAFVLNDGQGDAWALLKGNTAGLAPYVGDEVSVTGESGPVNPGTGLQESLTVSTFRVLLKPNPHGAQLRVDDPRNWAPFRNAKYGLTVRFPKGWSISEKQGAEALEDGLVEPNFIYFHGIVNVWGGTVPREAYPDSNFEGGRLAVFIAPSIADANTCLRFGDTEGARSKLRILRGIPYRETVTVSAGGGSGEEVFVDHTFQHGYCYEFDLEFGAQYGMDLTCSVQQLNRANEQNLVTALLSQVSFPRPAVANPVHPPTGKPTVTTLRELPLSPSEASQFSSAENPFALSWTSTGADYVQVRYPCSANVAIYGASQGPDDPMVNDPMVCGPSPNGGYPPNGTGDLEVNNVSTSAEPLTLTVVPVRNGIAYLKGAKTITVNVPPHQP